MTGAQAQWLRNSGIGLGGSVLVAICSRVSIPMAFTPVPLTLQPFAVLLLGLLLSPSLAAGTLLAYLAEGAAGLPVFAPGPASLPGIAHLFGPTAGYLLAYPLAAFAISLLWRRAGRNFAAALLAAGAGNLLILLGGAAWLAGLAHAAFGTLLAQAVVPFLPGDALKVVAAATLACGWQRIRRASSIFSSND